jgi:hypothetical protein
MDATPADARPSGPAVSQEAFQASLARLVTEAGFRALIRAVGEAATPSGLSELERRRLAQAARDHGLEVTASLVASYRLGKILGLLPLTRVLLGDEGLTRELRLFWEEHPPTSFYAADEALAFCGHLERRLVRGRLRRVYLAEVVAYERAVLELTRPRPAGDRPAPQRVAFRHDPARLVPCLRSGRRPRGIPERPCAFIGTLADDGTMDWSAEVRSASCLPQTSA